MVRSAFVTLACILMPLRLLCAQGAAEKNRCSYAHRYYCDQDGCRLLPHEGEYLLIPDLAELELAGTRHRFGEPPVQMLRCDARGCTPVDVTSSTSGAFLNVWKTDGGYMLKFVTVSLDLLEHKAGQFVEIATSMLGTFVSYGSCPWERR